MMRLGFQPDPIQAYPSSSYAEAGSTWHHMSQALHQSLFRVLELLFSLLPGLLAFVIAVGVMIGVGVLLSLGIRRVLTAAKFDERLTRGKANGAGGVADWAPSHSPTALVGRIAFWGSVLLGLTVGILALDASYANGAPNVLGGAAGGLSLSLLPYLSRWVGAVLLLFAGNIVARFLARTVLIGAVNNQLQYARFLSMGVKWLVLVLTSAMVLDHLGIGGAIVELAFGILFGGIVLTLSLAIGLGSRDIVSRSLERNAGKMDETIAGVGRPIRDSSETLRHF